MRKCISYFFCTSNHRTHIFKFIEFSIYSNESQDEQAADAGIPCRPDGPDGDRCTPPTLPPGLIQWILISLGLKIAFPIFHQARISHHHFCRGLMSFPATRIWIGSSRFTFQSYLNFALSFLRGITFPVSTGWGPPIGGCKSFWKVLRTGMTNLADFFAQTHFST